MVLLKEILNTAQQKQHIPRHKKLTRWKRSGTITVLAQTSTDTINHQLRDPYHLWHSQLQLTILICPQHYSTVILNYKWHNSSCSCLTCSPEKKKKISFLETVYTDFFMHFLQHYTSPFFKKIDKIIVLLLVALLSLSSSSISTINFFKRTYMAKLQRKVEQTCTSQNYCFA